MPVRRFRYGDLEARVEDVGAGTPTWRERGETAFEYRVTVRGPGGTYRTQAWGSMIGELDHRGMARMVVGELASAAADPDEFVEMVIGDERGRRALQRGREAEKVVEAARRIGADAVLRADEIAREEEERGGLGPEEWRPGE